MLCNFCKNPLTHVFCDLGHQPPSNSFLTVAQLEEPEITYPLKVYICDSCWLVQVPDYGFKPFTEEYPYYSSQSPSNVSHAKEYVNMMCERFGYNRNSFILEIGSNDGYLLQWFKKKGVKCWGIDAAEKPALEARKKGINTSIGFFGKTVKIDGGIYTYLPEYKHDLICGINVLAHQPDINDFVEGLRIALKPDGVITFEFPWLMKLVEGLQFDTIYQEHFSYFSFAIICKIFWDHGLDVFDVDILSEHGGSLRIYAQHETTGKWTNSTAARNLSDFEYKAGVNHLSYYQGFQSKINKIKTDFLDFLLHIPEDQFVIAYGAAAKGNTFLNYCGIHDDLIPMVIDRSTYKQGKFLPGSHVPVCVEEELKLWQPDYVLITAWNLKEEIVEQLKYIREWKGKFVVAIPNLEVL